MLGFFIHQGYVKLIKIDSEDIYNVKKKKKKKKINWKNDKNNIQAALFFSTLIIKRNIFFSILEWFPLRIE